MSTLRSRIFLALVAVAIVVLVLAGGATWLMVRGSAQRIAHDDLEAQAARLQSLTADLAERVPRAGSGATPGERSARLANVLVQIARGLEVTDSRLVFVAPDGTILVGSDVDRLADSLARRDDELATLIALPDGVTAADLDGVALRAGSVITGNHGTLVYRAEGLSRRVGSRQNLAVVVLTARADPEAQRRVAGAFGLGAAVALAVSICVAAALARRLGGPIGAAGAVAERIAAGDLGARVPIDPRGELELATLAASINRMAEDLERARGAERAFLLSVSHDLRTPLTSIRGYAEALRDGTLDAADPTARHRAAEVIHSEARRLERLVQDLLDLGRLDRREFSLHPRPVDAVAVVRDTAAGFAPQASELGLELEVDPHGPVPADLDAERLAQIVANLVENALKYATATVRITTDVDASGFVVRVTDDGPGIPPSEAERVFERLHTVRDRPGRSLGSGLGLAIVRELATAMGGTARAVVDPDVIGSTFEVRIALGGGS